MTSIPASQIVSVTPGVIAAGGSGVALNGLVLTASTRIPIGTVVTFPTALSVSNYFGASAPEYTFASAYFSGFNNSTVKPGALLMSQYPTAPVAGYLRGGSGLTLAQVQAIAAGTLTVSVDGTPKTSTSINLSTATSLSNAATLIQAQFSSLGGTVAYDSVSGAFTITSSTTGASSAVSFATGALSAALLLTQATGAVTSAGAIAATPAAAMTAIVTQTQNWASFTTLFEPVTADCVSFASWTNGQNNRYVYAMWDTDITVAGTNPTSSAGYLIIQAGYSGTVPIYSPTNLQLAAAFVIGIGASLSFTETNGRATAAFRYQSGLAPDVTDAVSSVNLLANGYNYIGAYATASQQFTFFYNGTVTGPFLWLDSYLDQIKLNSDLQAALMTLLTSAKSIPYNSQGYALIDSACAGPINAALNFGTIRTGVSLSDLQVAELNNAAGKVISTTVTTRGWYLLIVAATSAQRIARTSPSMILWYTDGQSVQSINFSSLEVQ